MGKRSLLTDGLLCYKTLMSSHILVSDLVINPNLAKNLVEDQFGISIPKVSLLGEGFDNTVYLINDSLVFRFPRRKVAIELIELELRLLPALVGLLPIAIPKPLFIGTPSPAYNALFYGHEILAGHSGCQVELSLEQFSHLAHDLGVFLKTLHNLDWQALSLDAAALSPMFDRVEREQMLIWLEERFQAVKEVFNLGQFEEVIQHIISDSASYKPRLKPVVLVHGDLYHRHLLFNKKGRLAGVIDWGDSCLSDRVVDLAIVYQFLHPDVRSRFFLAYGDVSVEELAYARFLGLYYVVSMLWYGDDRQDMSLITSSLTALARI